MNPGELKRNVGHDQLKCNDGHNEPDFSVHGKRISFSLFLFLRSEHERHSPQCPFVKGEYTQNVPLSGECTLKLFDNRI